MQLIPWSSGDSRETITFEPLEPGLNSGMYITVQATALEEILAHIEAWYEERDEVMLVDSGYSSKLFTGYIILEWIECEPDQLLAAIFDHEDAILDYCIYQRSEEVE